MTLPDHISRVGYWLLAPILAVAYGLPWYAGVSLGFVMGVLYMRWKKRRGL